MSIVHTSKSGNKNLPRIITVCKPWPPAVIFFSFKNESCLVSFVSFQSGLLSLRSKRLKSS